MHPTTGLLALIVLSLQWSSLHYSAHALVLLCSALLQKRGPTCTLDISPALCASEGIGVGVGVCECVYVRSSGFLFKCSWDRFHWPRRCKLKSGGCREGGGGVWRLGKLMRTETSYWKFAGGENLIYGWRIVCCFSPLFARLLKLNPRTKMKHKTTTTNISFEMLAGCYYAVRRALSIKQSIH